MKTMVLILLSAVMCTGCVQTDNMTTFYLTDGGSMDVVMLLDNVRSSKKGTEAKEELDKWLADFKADKIDEIQALKRAGVQGFKSKLLSTRPVVAWMSGHLPSVKALDKYFEMDKKGKGSGFRYERAHDQRILTIRVVNKSTPEKDPVIQRAPTFPILKFVIPAGRVIQATGFRVMGDRKTCIVDLDEVMRLDKTQKIYELRIIWSVAVVNKAT
jgi:hypothetical protein